nr:zinc finger, PMZ-type [Tanacetum cinerariifolium]
MVVVDRLSKYSYFMALIHPFTAIQVAQLFQSSPILYSRGQSKVDSVDRSLAAREAIIQMLQFHLQRAQARMKAVADSYRTERNFDVGHWILAKLGMVAYKLQLLPTAQIHPLFHVSQLKLFKGDLLAVHAVVPKCDPSVSDVKQIIDIQFEGMSYVQFRDVIRKLVHGPVASLYYCKVGTPLRIGIKPLQNDSDVDQFVNFAYKNKWQINLYVDHSGYNVLDIRDQGETMADDGNESNDAYCSSDEEDLSYIDFHSELDDNVIINTVSTKDPFLNKLCGDNVEFINLVDEPMNANVETVEEDTENIDHVSNVKEGISYVTHDPNQDWKKNKTYNRNEFKKRKKKELDEDESLKVNKVSTRSRSKSGEGTSKSPKTPVKAITSGPFIPYLKMKNKFREKFLINGSLGECKRAKQRALFDYEGGLRECYERLWEYRQAILDSNLGPTCRIDDEETESVPKRPKVNRPSVPKPHEYGTYVSERGRGRGSRGDRGGFGGRGEGTATMGESIATIGAIGRSQRGKGRGQRGRGKGQIQRDEMTEDEIIKNLEHDYMEDMLLQEEQKIDAYQAQQDEFDQEALRYTLEEEARFKRQDEERLKEQLAEQE